MASAQAVVSGPDSPEAAARFGINLFTRIPLSAGTTFVGALVYGVRKVDLVSGGRTSPPYALYYDWGDLPGFTIVPALQQAPPCSCQCTWLRAVTAGKHGCALPANWSSCTLTGIHQCLSCVPGACVTALPVQNGANLPINGTQFLVSSDLFTFSGISDARDGIPSLRTWAITHTERISQASSACMQLVLPMLPCRPSCPLSGNGLGPNSSLRGPLPAALAHPPAHLAE